MEPRLLSETLTNRFPNWVIASHTYRGDATVTVRPEGLKEIAKALRDDPEYRMNFLMDIAGVDWLGYGSKPAKGAFINSGVAARAPEAIPDEAPWPGPATAARFEVVYHFFSLHHKHRVRVKVPVELDRAEIDSVTELWATADWFEREIWDMYGIRFRGHPNLKRLLMYDEFEGHPLRKDYPVNKRQPLIGPVN